MGKPYEQRGEFDGDITYGAIRFGFTLLLIVAIAIVAIIAFLQFAVENRNENAGIAAYNTRVDEFNSYPREQRQAIIVWEQYTDYDPETLLRQHQELLPWHHPIPPFSEWNYLLIIIAIPTALSLLLFCAYCLTYNHHIHRLYDLPTSRYGKVLFLLMFAGWPFIFLDWLIWQIIENVRGWRELRQAAKRAEVETARRAEQRRKEAEARALEEAKPEFVFRLRPAVAKQCVPSMVPAHIEAFLKQRAKDERSEQIQDANCDVISFGNDVEALTRRLNELQGELDLVRTELETKQGYLANAQNTLNTLQAPQLSESDFSREAAAIGQMLLELPGIYKVCYVPADQTESGTAELRVYVRVVVEYRDNYYDVGDYMVYIESELGGCGYEEIRHSVREDASSTAPYYADPDNLFCSFVEHGERIAKLSRAGNYADALELAVQDLHYIKPEHMANIPKCFYRIDPERDPVIDHYLKEEVK